MQASRESRALDVQAASTRLASACPAGPQTVACDARRFCSTASPPLGRKFPKPWERSRGDTAAQPATQPPT
eukprot:12362131-Alexandrium_andersonii.AAC.1